VGLYIVAGILCSRPAASIKFPCLAVGKGPQLLFTASLTGLIALNLVVNQIFGVMPLLAGGQQARAESVPAPTLSLLSPDIGLLTLLVCLLTNIKSVRKLASLGIGISLVSTILGGSKSGIFSMLFIFFAADYVLNLKRVSSFGAVERMELRKKIKATRRVAIISAVVIAALLPTYLVLVGASSETGADSYVTMAVRLFGGFDGLAIIAAKNIDLTAMHDVSLSGFYFYPLLKKLSMTPQFQSAGSYLIYLITGSYQIATSGLNPNSTFPIELLLANGSVVLSGIFVSLTAGGLFRLRGALLEKGNLRMFDLVLWSLVVFGPFSMLLDGTYFVTRSYEFVGLYMVLNLGINALGWLLPGRKVFRLL